MLIDARLLVFNKVMEKMKMQSLDVTGSNIDKIARMFPQCVTERKDKDGKTVPGIDFEKLREELSADVIDEGEERYQFTWPDKKAHAHLANTPTTKTLRPCREESVDFDHTQNLYIEGDNLDVLKVLRETYLGKVKMIYIDPPYNTGNDFVYNDDFSQSAEEYQENSGQTVGLLQTGIQALEGRCDRVLIAGIDVPFLAEKTVRTLMDSDAPLCRPTVAGQPGGVLCIASSCFSALLSVPETTALEQLAACLHMPVSEVPAEDEGALAGGRERYPAMMERRRHEPIHVTFKLRLCRERPFFGPGTVQLLTQIDETESVRLACRQMGISYSKGWKMIALMEEELGEQVVSRRQGGKNGGAASLTGVGRELVDKYQRLERRCQELIEQAREEIFPSN